MNRYFLIAFIFTGCFQCKDFSSQSLSSNYNIYSFFQTKRNGFVFSTKFYVLVYYKKIPRFQIVFSAIFVDTLCIHEDFLSNINNFKFFKIEKSIIIGQCVLLIFDYK